LRASQQPKLARIRFPLNPKKIKELELWEKIGAELSELFMAI
jgi:hypothetical protein